MQGMEELPASEIALGASPSIISDWDLKTIAKIVYEAMGPGTPTLTYGLIAQRCRLFIDDAILGLGELQRQRKVVLIHRKGDISKQMAFRVL
jgi:hypothetical protein